MHIRRGSYLEETPQDDVSSTLTTDMKSSFLTHEKANLSNHLIYDMKMFTNLSKR
jgi:hypothetical protein